MLIEIVIVLIVLTVVYVIVRVTSVGNDMNALRAQILQSQSLDSQQLDKLRALISTISTSVTVPAPVAVGTVLTHASGSPPDDSYMLCDGSKLPISAYATLFSVIGSTYTTDATLDRNVYFQLPDLRGQFVRGFDPTNALRALGSLEQDATALPKSSQFKTDTQGAHAHTTDTQGAHVHDYYRSYIGNSSNLYHTNRTDRVSTGEDNRTYTNGSETFTTAGAHSHTTNIQGAHVHSVVSGGDSETRPRNIALTYIIKVK